MHLAPELLYAAVGSVLALAAFRTLPIVGYLLVSKHIRPRGKVASVAAYLALGVPFLPDGPSGLLKSVAFYAWFVVMAYWTHRAADSKALARVKKPILLCGCALAFLVVPAAAALDIGPIKLVIGADVTLSAYSYLVEARETKRTSTFGECLFFLLVNPVLVFPDRGTQTGNPAFSLRGLGRAALGLLALGTGNLLGAATAAGFASFLGVIGTGGLFFLSLYFRHSGLASFQIGLLAQLGHRIPERYDFPLAAAGPAEFWRRWNTYIGRWFERYVFFPAAVALARKSRVRPWFAKSFALLVTFAAVGVLHDAFDTANDLAPSFAGLARFTRIGVVVLIWLAAERALQRSTAGTGRRFGGLVLRLAFWALVLFSFGERARI
jgi:hypothetical protein